MGALSKRRFAGKFLLAFTVLLVLWWAVDFPTHYRTAVLASAQMCSPAVNGWWLDYDRPDAVGNVVFRAGDRELAMLLQLRALSMGIVPLVSLVVATPRQSVKRIARNVVLGVVLYFAVHVAVVLTYPFIMNRPNALKDTLGVFTGLMAFVVAPLGLWFMLTYPALRSLWQLNPHAGRTKT
ncbi:MAG: hypothetical protein ACE5I7_11290 [Candidatus Binatia bacterium]